MPYDDLTYVGDLPDVDRYYPVIVETTQHHVLWIQASSPAEAVDLFDAEPYDPSDTSLYGFDWTSRAPHTWDWDQLRYRGDGTWAGMQADAHVLAWRDEQYRRRREAQTIQPVGGLL